jgi:hypothetical protein
VITVASGTASGAVLNDVYCIVNRNTRVNRYLSSAPSLGGGVCIRVCDEQMRQFGHVVSGMGVDKDGGVTCDLAIDNASEKAEAVNISVSSRGNSPDFRRALFDPAARTFAEAHEDSVVRMHVNLQPGEIGYYQLIAGSDAYLAKFKLNILTLKTALIGIYQNPVKQSVRIRFSLPMSVSNHVQFSIFDARGREVWSTAVNCRGGINDIVWSGNNKSGRHTSSGAYFFHMTAFDAKGNPAGAFGKKLIYLP